MRESNGAKHKGKSNSREEGKELREKREEYRRKEKYILTRVDMRGEYGWSMLFPMFISITIQVQDLKLYIVFWTLVAVILMQPLY